MRWCAGALVRWCAGALVRWCAQGGRAAVRLVTGDGGAGKTRLALQLGEVLAANGWQQLWVPRGSERDVVRDARKVGQPCVLVADYAEPRGELVGLVDDVAATRDGPDLRVLLLARCAGEWWQQLLASVEERAAALLDAAAPITLGPVPAAGGPQEVFDDALTAFASKFGTRRPHSRLILTDPNPVVLVVHAAALLKVVDSATRASLGRQAVSGAQVLGGLLAHEARYWVRSAASRALSLDVSVLRRAVMVSCLIGAGSETSAEELLTRIPDLDSAKLRGQVARWLHDLYPATHEQDLHEQEWLSPLRPDRLAEQLVAEELARQPELIPRLFTGLDDFRAARALTVLARAALIQDSAIDLLRRALAADLDHLAVPALSVAVETNRITADLLSQAFDSQPVSRETLARVAATAPYPSFALAAPMAIVFKRLADISTDDAERARWLGGLGNRLGDLGRREEALAAVEEATRSYRQLAQARPDAFLPDLAGALNNESGSLADLERHEEALAAVEEATRSYRQLAQARPDAFLPNLAASLNNQSNRLFRLGRREEALAVVEEATRSYRQLVQARPDAFLPDLATSLTNHSARLALLGRAEESVAAAEEAVTIRRELAQARPAFLPDLARSLRHPCRHAEIY